MITSNRVNNEVVESFHFLNKGNNFIRGVTLGSEKEDPSVPGVLINNDKCIFLSSYGLDIDRSKEIQMEKLKRRVH
jgi:hypothetical protein